MLSKIVSTMTSESLRLMSTAWETSSISSALVMVRSRGASSATSYLSARGRRLTIAASGARSGLRCLRGGSRFSRTACGRWVRRRFRFRSRFLDIVSDVFGDLLRNRILLHVVQAQSNPLFAGAEANHPEAKLSSHVHRMRTAGAVVVAHFGNMAKALDPLFKLDESAIRGHPRNSSAQRVPVASLCKEGLPNVRLELFQPQREPAMLRIKGQDHGLDPLALFENLGRVFHLLRPGKVRKVDQSVDTFFDLDEGAEICKVAHPAFDHRAHAEPLAQRRPRVRQGLPQAERDAPLPRIHLEHRHLDPVTHIDDLRGMLQPLAPGHLRDVDQALDAWGDLDKSSVVRDADHAAEDAVAGAVVRRYLFPGIGQELLQAQGDSLLFRHVLQHLNSDL